MSAHDHYEGAARCPRCGDWHYLYGQLDFFDPDFGGYHSRDFTPGAKKPYESELSIAEIDAMYVSDSDAWRVRAPRGDGRLDLVPELDRLHCDCGLDLVVVLRFALAPGTTPDDAPRTTAVRDACRVRLLTIELRDSHDYASTDVDFAPPSDALRDLDEARRTAVFENIADPSIRSEAARSNRLRFEAELFARADEPDAESRARLHASWLEAIPTSPCVTGSVRCERCGDERARSYDVHYQTLPGGGAFPSELRPGLRLELDEALLEQREDIGTYARERHPVGSSTLTFALFQSNVACKCGAGFGAIILYVDRSTGVVRSCMGLRAITCKEDAADIDFVSRGRTTMDLVYRSARVAMWAERAGIASVFDHNP